MIIKKILVKAASLAVLTLGILTSQVYAQGSQGMVKLEVQDVTDGTPFVDANTEDAALHVAPGDTLVYRVTISNTAAAAADGSNDLVDVVLGVGTRTGVDLVGPYQVSDDWKFIEDNTLSNIAPGDSTVMTYTATVVSTTEGDVIQGAGVFTGNDRDANNYQSAFDFAYVYVDLPDQTPTPDPTTPTTPETPSGETINTTPETPQTPQAPQTPQTPVTPEKLPNTGSSTGMAMAFALVAAVGGYAFNTLRLRRNNG